MVILGWWIIRFTIYIRIYIYIRYIYIYIYIIIVSSTEEVICQYVSREIHYESVPILPRDMPSTQRAAKKIRPLSSAVIWAGQPRNQPLKGLLKSKPRFNRGTPIAGWFIVENPSYKWMIWGYLYFRKHSNGKSRYFKWNQAVEQSIGSQFIDLMCCDSDVWITHPGDLLCVPISVPVEATGWDPRYSGTCDQGLVCGVFIDLLWPIHMYVCIWLGRQ